MDIKVYQATIKDLDELVTLFDLYRNFYGQPSDLAGARHFLHERLEHQQSVLLLAKYGAAGQAVGFVQLYPTFSSISMKRSWILNDLYVLEDFRKLGVAQALLDEAKVFAQLTHAKGIELSTGLSNEKAQRLYERNGYQKDEQFYHYYLAVSHTGEGN